MSAIAWSMRTSRPLLGSTTRSALSPLFAFGLAAVGACNVYDESLLTGGAAQGAGGASSGGQPQGGQGGAGGMVVACDTPEQCPGTDNECGTRTCADGTCGIDAVAQGTVTTDQMAGDCIENQCDGAGNIVGVIDNGDLPNDDNDCTDDLCTDGIPSNDPVAVHSSCTGAGGAKVCNAAAECVECTLPGDCTSGSCTDEFSCAPASCTDTVVNNGETDLNCGGPNCTACVIGKHCLVDGDCLSNSCAGNPLTCQESCTDGITNQDETDLDCGGVCDPCGFGQLCDVGNDCETGACSGSGHCTCPPNDGVLLISEFRTRGPGAGNDEFVELYNPGTVAVTLTSSWILQNRSSTAGSYGTRFTGSGEVVQPGHHFLIGGSSYAGGAAADAALTTGIADEGSLVLKNGATTVDAVCFRCGSADLTGYTCEGGIAMKTGCTNNVDKSLERKPGSTQGNCIDTQDNLSDFAEITPSNPEDLASPAVP